MIRSVLFDLLNRCSVWLVSHRSGSSLSAAVCAPAPFLGGNLQRDCAIFGSMREANVTAVVPSTGVAVPGARWYCAWCQWYEICCGSSGIEAVPVPPRLHRGLVCCFALRGLWVGVASVPVHERVACPILCLCWRRRIRSDGRRGKWASICTGCRSEGVRGAGLVTIVRHRLVLHRGARSRHLVRVSGRRCAGWHRLGCGCSV